ncbi:hypothetical protein CLF_107294 [Clonorchis sinensis]|uniref:Uncharacterized protein n=1 Tax=Clonorchis sinensis TaxID=79923 RepID=G7YQI6_CLOSI|nr:hypothetical protein CLF_107294 [Clonorchis sinensis]
MADEMKTILQQKASQSEQLQLRIIHFLTGVVNRGCRESIQTPNFRCGSQSPQEADIRTRLPSKLEQQKKDKCKGIHHRVSIFDQSYKQYYDDTIVIETIYVHRCPCTTALLRYIWKHSTVYGRVVSGIVHVFVHSGSTFVKIAIGGAIRKTLAILLKSALSGHRRSFAILLRKISTGSGTNLRHLWHQRDVNRRVYTAVVRSILLYGSEAWPICAEYIRKMSAFSHFSPIELKKPHIIIIIDSMTSVFNTDASLPYSSHQILNASALQMDVDAAKQWSLIIIITGDSNISVDTDASLPYNHKVHLIISNALEKSAQRAVVILRMIRRTFLHITHKDLEVLCGVYVRPLLEYANQDFYSGRKDVSLIRVQRASTKIAPDFKSADYEEPLKMFDFFPLECRHLRGGLLNPRAGKITAPRRELKKQCLTLFGLCPSSERKPLNDENKPDQGSLSDSIDPVHQIHESSCKACILRLESRNGDCTSSIPIDKPTKTDRAVWLSNSSLVSIRYQPYKDTGDVLAYADRLMSIMCFDGRTVSDSENGSGRKGTMRQQLRLQARLGEGNLLFHKVPTVIKDAAAPIRFRPYSPLFLSFNLRLKLRKLPVQFTQAGSSPVEKDGASSMVHNKCGRNGCPSNVRRGMQCHTCKTWWHFKCTGLQDDQVIERVDEKLQSRLGEEYFRVSSNWVWRCHAIAALKYFES